MPRTHRRAGLVSLLAVVVGACADTGPLQFPVQRSGLPTAAVLPLPGTAPPAVPPPVPSTAHPRMWIRPADVDRLRSWATPANAMYALGLQPAVAAAIVAYDTRFFPGGQPAASWPDPGGTAWTAYATEAYAELFAFMSLVDPDPAARPAHGARARNLLMHVIAEAAKGVDSSSSPAPFRGPGFSTYNRAQ